MCEGHTERKKIIEATALKSIKPIDFNILFGCEHFNVPSTWTLFAFKQR